MIRDYSFKIPFHSTSNQDLLPRCNITFNMFSEFADSLSLLSIFFFESFTNGVFALLTHIAKKDSQDRVNVAWQKLDHIGEE